MAVSLSVSIVLFKPPLTPRFEAVWESLCEAVEDAVNQGVLSKTEVTLIDNGQNEDLSKVAVGTPDFVRFSYLKNDKNLGYSAHNQSINPSTADLHLVLNPDVLLHRSALTNGINYLNSSPETAMICPYSLDDQGAPSYLCKRYPALLDLLLRGFAAPPIRRRFDNRLKRYEYRDLDIEAVAESIELISGCCMLARTSALQACAGFDAGFFLYFEDFDLSIRMRKQGRLDYEPAMKITHFGGNAARKGLKHIFYFARSAARFYRKHGFRFV